MRPLCHCLCCMMAAFSLFTIFLPPALSAENDTTPDSAAMMPDAELDSVLASIEENLGKIKTLKTKIIQEKKISLFSEPVFSNGILLFKSPDKIRLEYFDPFRSVLLVNENNISKYEMINGTWQKTGSGDEKMMQVILDHIITWITGRFNEKNLYTVSGRCRKAGDQTACCILLEPRAEGFKAFISGFELGISKDMNRLDYIIIKESGQDYTKLTFHDDQVNGPVEDLYFKGDTQTFPPAPQW